MVRRIRLPRWSLALIGVVVVFAFVAGVLAWEKVFRTEPQTFTPGAANFGPQDMRFAYGSLGSELTLGIPYPVFMVLPRVFPDLAAKYGIKGYGPAKQSWGGYGAFGMPWEGGQRLPVGMSIKRAGYERVTVNCAFCHTATYRLSAADDERFALGGPSHTTDFQALLRFLFACANDQRFNAARLLPEIALNFKLDPVDKAMYGLWLIPETRLKLRFAEHELGFMEQRTPWGPGGDDAFNLPKFVLAQLPWDDSVSNTDFPAVWKLAQRDGGLLHAGGEARELYSVVATSAMGVGALPNSRKRDEINRWTMAYVRAKAPPAYPLPVDAGLAARGGSVFQAACVQCHAVGGARTGTAIPQAEVGTDPEHLRAWTQRDADAANRVTRLAGFGRAKFLGASGYVAKPLVGVWLLGPYLHNGSVPTVADLLNPPDQRPQVFWRGYDVIDPVRVGYQATDAGAQAAGFRYDTRLKGNGNGGHLYGVPLPEADKRALLEYLKTL